MKSMRSGTSGASDSNNQGAAQVFTQTGIYRGNTVAIRPIKKTSITMTRDDLLEMKVVSVFIFIHEMGGHRPDAVISQSRPMVGCLEICVVKHVLLPC